MRTKKFIRAKVVVNFIYDFLKEGLNLAEAECADYLKNIVVISDNKRQTLKQALHNNEGLLKRVSGEINERSLKIVEFSQNDRVREENSKRINILQDEEENLKVEIAKIKERLTDPEKDRLTTEQFLNLSKNAGNIVQSADAVVKDKIVRLIFLNFTVDEE